MMLHETSTGNTYPIINVYIVLFVLTVSIPSFIYGKTIINRLYIYGQTLNLRTVRNLVEFILLLRLALF